MIYTMSEILEYANYSGQMAKIETGCNLIIESAMESLSIADTEETYTEGVESIVNSMITMVSAAFKAIMDFIGKQVEKVDNIINGKKYQMMMSPEMKAKFDEMTAGKDVKGIDTVALLKLSKKSEAFIDKFMTTVNVEISKAQSDPSYDTSHLKDYCKHSEEAYDKLYKEMERIGTTKKSLKKADFYAMIKSSNEIITSMTDYKKKMRSMEKQLTATIKKLNKAGYLKEFTEDDNDFRVYNEGVIESIKFGIQKVISSLKNFCIKHARVCQYVCMAISTVSILVIGKTTKDLLKVDAMVDDIIDANKRKKVPYVDPMQIRDFINKRYPNATSQQKQKMFTTFYKKCADYNKPYEDNIRGAIDEGNKSIHHTNKVTGGMTAVGTASAIAAAKFKEIADAQDRKKKAEK